MVTEEYPGMSLVLICTANSLCYLCKILKEPIFLNGALNRAHVKSKGRLKY